MKIKKYDTRYLSIKIDDNIEFPTQILIKFKNDELENYAYHIPDKIFYSIGEILDYFNENQESKYLKVKIQGATMDTKEILRQIQILESQGKKDEAKKLRKKLKKLNS